VLFDGTGPDVSEENLAPLRNLVLSSKATAGLATDGDADRFGIVDSDGTWIQPNLILALVYDYLVESRGWKNARRPQRGQPPNSSIPPQSSTAKKSTRHPSASNTSASLSAKIKSLSVAKKAPA